MPPRVVQGSTKIGSTKVKLKIIKMIYNLSLRSCGYQSISNIFPSNMIKTIILGGL